MWVGKEKEEEEPAEEPAAEPAAEPAVELAAEPAVELAAEPAAELAVELATANIIERDLNQSIQVVWQFIQQVVVLFLLIKFFHEHMVHFLHKVLVLKFF